jgi:hypothetical protein
MPQLASAAAAIHSLAAAVADMGQRVADARGMDGVEELLRCQAGYEACSDDQRDILKALLIAWGVYPTSTAAGCSVPLAIPPPAGPSSVLRILR